MGHLPIVTQESLKNVIDTACISTTGRLGKRKIKTIADIFSDALATRKGDLVFPWIVKGKKSANLGFQYVFRVAEKPFFVKGDTHPVKIPIEKIGWKYEKPLSEANAFKLWERKLLWNAIGKKSLQRGRSITHQTPMEDKFLLNLLKRNSKKSRIRLGKKRSAKGEPIKIDLSQSGGKIGNRLSSLRLRKVKWSSGKRFSYEKVLEAWLMENIDKILGKSFRKNVLESKEKIEWFGNYLPFGVAGGNMDITIIESGYGRKIVTLVELKRDEIRKSEFHNAARQVVEYSLFMKAAFCAYGVKIRLNPVIISASPEKRIEIPPVKINGLTPKWVIYKLGACGKVDFEKVL